MIHFQFWYSLRSKSSFVSFQNNVISETVPFIASLKHIYTQTFPIRPSFHLDSVYTGLTVILNSLAKNRVEGCFLINEKWCSDSQVLSSSCSPELETLTIKCTPFYSPREFSSLIIISAYIPKWSKNAVLDLASKITPFENDYPSSLFIVLGDFNQTNLRDELPRYKQQVNCPTRGANILDHCYCRISNAYHAISRQPLSYSDHMVYLVPPYHQKLKALKPLVKKKMLEWWDNTV